MRTKRADLVEALTGRFDDHHAELARILLDQIDGLTTHIDRLTTRVEQLIAAMPAAQAPETGGDRANRPAAAPGQEPVPTDPLPAQQRLQEIPGVGRPPPKRSWPRLGWTCRASRPPGTSPPGPN